jgi:hypothetical protein
VIRKLDVMERNMLVLAAMSFVQEEKGDYKMHVKLDRLRKAIDAGPDGDLTDRIDSLEQCHREAAQKWEEGGRKGRPPKLTEAASRGETIEYVIPVGVDGFALEALKKFKADPRQCSFFVSLCAKFGLVVEDSTLDFPKGPDAKAS